MDANVLIVIGTFTGLFIGLPGTALSILLLMDRQVALHKSAKTHHIHEDDMNNEEIHGCE